MNFALTMLSIIAGIALGEFVLAEWDVYRSRRHRPTAKELAHHAWLKRLHESRRLRQLL